MSDESKPKLSALAMARRINDITLVWTAEDVRRIRPAWSGPEADQFLQQHKAEIAHVLLEAGLALLKQLIESHEQEAADDQP